MQQVSLSVTIFEKGSKWFNLEFIVILLRKVRHILGQNKLKYYII